MDMIEIAEADIIEAVRLIGEGKHWDAPETLRRSVDDVAVIDAIEVAQFKVEIPW